MLVERGIYWYRVAEGSVDQTLSEKMCNRSVRVVKLIYEALSCMLLDKFIEDMWRRICSRFQSERGRYTCILTKDLREDELNEVIEKETFKSFNKNYVDSILALVCWNDSSITKYHFWNSGNLELLFESLRDMVSYAFDYNNMHYTRYLTTMLGECYN